MKEQKYQRIQNASAEEKFKEEQYHDEGFIEPKDAEFFILSHKQKTKNHVDIQALLKKFPNCRAGFSKESINAHGRRSQIPPKRLL